MNPEHGLDPSDSYVRRSTEPETGFLSRVLSVPRPRAGELAITEELGPRGRRTIAALTAASLGLVLMGLWWMFNRLNAPTRLYPDGQFQGELWKPFTLGTTWRFLWKGISQTLSAAAVGIVLSLIIGTLMASLRHGAVKRPWFVTAGFASLLIALVVVAGVLFGKQGMLIAATGVLIVGLAVVPQASSTLYVEFFRACALVLLVASPFRFFGVRPWASVVIGLTLYYSTTIAEVTRSALRSLPKGQTEAGLAVGLTPRQTMTSILLPQGLKRALPNLLTQTASLLKDTSLGFLITFRDLLAQSQTLGKEYDNYLPTLIVCAALYIAMIGSINFLANRIQRRQR
jgi:glutamate transport system permease protein